MPVKPFLMADLQKTAPPSPSVSHRASVGIGTYNRFNLLAPNRGRIKSTGKRLLSDDDNPPASRKIPRFDANQVFEKLASHDLLLDAAKGSLSVARAAIGHHYKQDDGALGTILFQLGAAMEKVILHSDAMKSNLVDMYKTMDTKPTYSGNPAHSKATNSAPKAAKQVPAKQPPSAADTALLKVKRVLREAERRTVMFDLDLGAAPLINKESISKKVTYALHQAAASGEHDWNIKDAGTMVDDALSCSQLEFLGSGTRKFFNNKKQDDPHNGKMCTVPVRMDFKNKETRQQAEHTLRSICKVNCSTPYPKKLRALLGRAILDGKKKFPKNYIRTKVDIDNMQVTASVREGASWVVVSGPYPIHLDILDPNTVIPPPEIPEISETTNMETNTTAENTNVS